MANAKIIEQKQQIVAALAEQMRNASSGVLVDYKGITVENDTKLRADLRKAGVQYAVVKNALCARACDELGYTELKNVLEGNTALALSEDLAKRHVDIVLQKVDTLRTEKVIANTDRRQFKTQRRKYGIILSHVLTSYKF